MATMEQQRAALAAKVQAVNAVHKEALALYPFLADVFRPLIGQKVVKADGTLLAKVKALLPTFQYTVLHSITPRHDRYSLRWLVQDGVRLPGDGGCIYHDINVGVGCLKDGVLIQLYPPFEGRADYTVAEIEANRARYADAAKAQNEALTALTHFGVAGPL
jgi:hypothetical protein